MIIAYILAGCAYTFMKFTAKWNEIQAIASSARNPCFTIVISAMIIITLWPAHLIWGLIDGFEGDYDD